MIRRVLWDILRHGFLLPARANRRTLVLPQREPLTMLSSEPIEAALELLRAEYLDTPTLMLTPGDAAELLDLDRATALAAVEVMDPAVPSSEGSQGRWGAPPTARLNKFSRSGVSNI